MLAVTEMRGLYLCYFADNMPVLMSKELIEKKLRHLTRTSTSNLFFHIDNEHVIQILSFVGGFVDAYGYLNVKQLFTSSITGNIVVASAYIVADTGGVGSRSLVSAVFTISAGLGAFLAVRLRASKGWNHPCLVSIVLFALELLLLASVIIVGLYFRVPLMRINDQDHPLIMLIASLLASSMGIQLVAVKQSIRNAPSTTVMTTSLIDLAQYGAFALGYLLAYHRVWFLLPRRMHKLRDREIVLKQMYMVWSLKFSIVLKPLILFVVGALAGALLSLYVSFWALVVPCLLVGLIMFEIGQQITIADSDQVLSLPIAAYPNSLRSAEGRGGEALPQLFEGHGPGYASDGSFDQSTSQGGRDGTEEVKSVTSWPSQTTQPPSPNLEILTIPDPPSSTFSLHHSSPIFDPSALGSFMSSLYSKDEWTCGALNEEDK